MYRKRSFKRNDFNSIFTLLKIYFYYFILFPWNILVFLYLNGESYLFEQTALIHFSPGQVSIPFLGSCCFVCNFKGNISRCETISITLGASFISHVEKVSITLYPVFMNQFPLWKYHNLRWKLSSFFFFLLFYLSPSSSWNARKIGYDYTQKSNSNRSIVNKLGTNRVIFKHRNIS